MQALKALVIFMGVLIIAGMGLLVYGLMTRVSWDDKTVQADAPPASTSVSFAGVSSALPAGATVESVAADNGRAVVHVRLVDGGAEIRLFDLATGAATGTIQLKAAP
jgi:hypothetical protein